MSSQGVAQGVPLEVICKLQHPHIVSCFSFYQVILNSYVGMVFESQVVQMCVC
jgi:hypothetical protein